MLQAHLLTQLASSSYDLAANLALLKLYQFNPPLLETASTLQIIFLAIVNNPFGPDSLLVKALLADTFINGNSLPPHPDNDDDEERQPEGEREIVDKLQELSDALLARKFSTFWEIINALRVDGGDKAEMQVKAGIRELMEVTVGWETKLRGEILAQVQDTFTGIKREVVERFLGLDSASRVPLFCWFQYSPARSDHNPVQQRTLRNSHRCLLLTETRFRSRRMPPGSI